MLCGVVSRSLWFPIRCPSFTCTGHSEYSQLDGANRIDDLIERVLELEQPALAITDHGNLHAAWTFQEKAKKAGIKRIIGMEAYVAPGHRRSSRARPAPGAKPYDHLVLLARNSAGYKNFVKLSSFVFTEGFYTKPRVDCELLAKIRGRHYRVRPRVWPARSRRTSWEVRYRRGEGRRQLVR